MRDGIEKMKNSEAEKKNGPNGTRFFETESSFASFLVKNLIKEIKFFT